MTTPQTTNQPPYQPRVATSPDRDSQTSPKDQKPLKPSKSSKKPYIFGMVFCALLAAAGIAFGVYGLLNTQSKDSEIAELKVQISDKDQEIASFEAENLTFENDDTSIEISDSAPKNPIISATAPEFYNIGYSINYYDYEKQARYKIDFSTRDGDIVSCQVFSENTYQNDCTLSGLNGKVYKITMVGEGQNISQNPEIAFLMEDGTVAYTTAPQFSNSPNATIEGTYNIDGFVTDIRDVLVGNDNSPIGGYGTYIFVLSDGSYLPYGQISK